MMRQVKLEKLFLPLFFTTLLIYKTWTKGIINNIYSLIKIIIRIKATC